MAVDRPWRRLRTVLPIVVLLAMWATVAAIVGPHRLPGPIVSARTMATTLFHSQLIQAQGGGAAGFMPHVFATAVHAGVGSLIGILLGLGLAGVASQVRSAAGIAVDTFLEVGRVVPPLLVVPFLAVAVGPTRVMSTAAVAAYAAMTTAIYAIDALKRLPREYDALGRLLGAGPLRLLMAVRIPGIVPDLLGVIRLVLAYGLGIAVVTEFLATPVGIGRVMKLAVNVSAQDVVVAGIAWTVVTALVFEMAVVTLFAALLTWTDRRRLIDWMARRA